ncbi:DUF317 domain-containing protein [Streptomyces lydicamycinicus]|uniref:DUF317 domain-containing protein n=1 Tax=Streptomyces lydicamycinicus TaxID=1546107 RepID=UPI003C2F6DF2
MPVSERQLEAFADTHAWRIPFDTSPRYLAGPGDGRHVTHGLAAAGWIRTSDPLSPEIVLTSPDRRYRLQFDPQSATSAWWRLWAEPTDGTSWYAEFGELVPAEILAGLTDALIGPPPSEQPNPFRSLGWAGWVIEAQNSAVSLDGMCHVELRTSRVNGSAPHWHIETAEPLAGRLGAQIWHASFDEHTPAHLVEAFVTALASPAPLQRGMYQRTAHHSAVQKPSHPPTRQQALDAHTTRLDALRTQARAARRRQQPATTTAPAPPTSTSSALRR